MSQKQPSARGATAPFSPYSRPTIALRVPNSGITGFLQTLARLGVNRGVGCHTSVASFCALQDSEPVLTCHLSQSVLSTMRTGQQFALIAGIPLMETSL